MSRSLKKPGRRGFTRRAAQPRHGDPLTQRVEALKSDLRKLDSQLDDFTRRVLRERVDGIAREIGDPQTGSEGPAELIEQVESDLARIRRRIAHDQEVEIVFKLTA